MKTSRPVKESREITLNKLVAAVEDGTIRMVVANDDTGSSNWSASDRENYWQALASGISPGPLSFLNSKLARTILERAPNAVLPVDVSTEIVLDGTSRIAEIIRQASVTMDDAPDTMVLSCDFVRKELRYTSLGEHAANHDCAVLFADIATTQKLSKTLRQLHQDGRLDDDAVDWLDDISDSICQARFAVTTYRTDDISFVWNIVANTNAHPGKDQRWRIDAYLRQGQLRQHLAAVDQNEAPVVSSPRI